MLQTQLKLYVTHRHNSEIKNVLVSKQNALMSEKFSTDINLAPLCLMRIKNICGGLVLDLLMSRENDL